MTLNTPYTIANPTKTDIGRIYYENSHYSTKGIAAEVGMMYRFNRLIMSVGTQTISGKHWLGNIGFGIHF